jgi:hypothetical protein
MALDLFTKLSRHESHLTRQMERIVGQLRKMKAKRSVAAKKAAPVLPSRTPFPRPRRQPSAYSSS